MLHLTQADQKAIQQATSMFAARINSMRREADLGGNIASLRYWMLERAGEHRDVLNLRLLMCKLTYEAKLTDPSALTKYYVFPAQDLYDSKLRDLPIVQTLKSAYTRIREYEGFGTWANKPHEIVFADLCGYMSGQVHVINKEAYNSLIRAYDKQTSEAEAARDVALIGSAAERKASGKCYRCACPKPRKIPCGVCGYVPGGA